MTNKQVNILVTGGAGFIGSNLADALIQDDRVSKVRVLDNLETGFLHNIEHLLLHPKFEFIEGDIRDFSTCMQACANIDLVSHQAALGSVPRSLKDPLKSHEVNVTGTLNIMQAAVQQGVTRVIFAASSSTYGDSKELPKTEDKIGRPLSPYAATKLINEIYAEVYCKVYGLQYIGLRYFNVFGPRQHPEGPYAAVIPLFFKAALHNIPPVINGDGTNTRDFTYVDNAVEANIKGLFTDNQEALNQVYNVACGKRTSLNELWEFICDITGSKTEPQYGPPRSGDIPHSLADISKANHLLGYSAGINIREGLDKTGVYYKTIF
jgi:UDP-N-acetylglucosamine 4-epimerase